MPTRLKLLLYMKLKLPNGVIEFNTRTIPNEDRILNTLTHSTLTSLTSSDFIISDAFRFIITFFYPLIQLCRPQTQKTVSERLFLTGLIIDSP